jgi:putative endonuclease
MFTDKHRESLSRVDKGSIGELVAEKYLCRMGWKTVGRNTRIGGCELDIVARDPEGILVAVEVKFSQRRGGGYSPEDRLNKRKVAAVSRGLCMFADKHPELIKKGIRVDGLCLVPHNPAILTDDEKDYEIIIYHNVLATFAE